VSEAKDRFIEHLQKTRVIGKTLKLSYRVTSSLSGVARDVTTLSRTEIGAGKLVRSLTMSRVEGYDEARILLDQTIDLNTTGPGTGGAATKIAFLAWDQNGERARLVPIDGFMAFPGTSLRLLDYLLPVPELVAAWTLTGDGPGQDMIELALRDPLPPSLADWLSPGMNAIRFHIDHADLRLRSADVVFGSGHRHDVRVDAWSDLGAIHGLSDFTVTDGADWTRTELTHAAEKHGGAELFTRLRLEQNSF
jgi:hypothetical protein